ncbi:uncharacterized protein B0H18DRAFT_1112274 [Fomitopsis serialis]|uniref:uncharacterized protein n=1 Tax=Fomitopsis serialis TaxID=139415 RepID=UPI0020080BAA|nr:uncharacterized protein B0H18DRAFT_1112274 [Neoantrodia serialis]KAH9938085.1 hypothetical protein B0H18DRAFT_1112274 [Neoantrodia serialis]
MSPQRTIGAEDGNDPFLLASYPVPIRPARPSSRQAAGTSSHVLVDSRYASTADKTDNLVSLAVQEDGVHVLDLSTLHPAISHTLGPNTTFSCPPTSRTSKGNGAQTCTTYAVIASSPDIQEEDEGRTVLWWEESLSGGVMTADTQKKRKSTVLSHKITHIYAPKDLPDHLLLVGLGGEITVTDSVLNVQASSPTSEEDDTVLLRHFVLPRQSSTFVPTQTSPSSGVVSISALRRNTDVLLHISLVDAEGRIHSLGSCVTPVEETDIADVSFSTSGCLTVLTRSGKWTSYRVSVSPSSTLSISPLCPPSTSLPSPSSRPPEPTPPPTPQRSPSSRYILPRSPAGVTIIGPEMILLLWDTQYGVVLAEQRFPCPLHLYRGKDRGTRMSLVASGSADEPSQALLVLHPADASQDSQYERATSVLAVPLSVPKTSTIANALGRAAASQNWLRPDADSSQKPRTAHLALDLGGLEPEQGRALKAMLEAQERGRTEEVEKRWTAYREDAGGPGKEPRLGHLFVKQLLNVLFAVPLPGRDGAAPPSAAQAYARGIVTYLLEKKAVSDAMIEGGLIPALMPNAVLAMSNVIDLPESDIISLLAKVVAHHRQSNPDAMQVDSPSSPPALPAFLALCVTYSTSPGPLRVALRKHLPDAEAVVCVLEVLDSWVGQWSEEELSLVPEKVKKDAHGAYVAVYAEESTPEMPPLDKILLFTQAILDSSFLALLSHAPAHPLLRSLLARLEPELALISELQSLKGPLQGDAQADWRQRKKAQTEHRDMNIGIYQVEELVI